MTNQISELGQVARDVRLAAVDMAQLIANCGILSLQEKAESAGKSWSGSWLGYHANVYYRDLKRAPPGARFSSEWGLKSTFSEGTKGEWVEYDPDKVEATILKRAGQVDLEKAETEYERSKRIFVHARESVLSILELAGSTNSDTYLGRLLDQTKRSDLITPRAYVNAMSPSGQLMTRDTAASTQGICAPPHILLLARTTPLTTFEGSCESIADIAEKAASHLQRLEHNTDRARRIGTNVFIGHGRSPAMEGPQRLCPGSTSSSLG